MFSSMTWTVYVLSVLMNMRDTMIGISIFIAVIGMLNCGRWAILYDNDSDTAPAKCVTKWCIGGVIGIMFFISFLPTERQVVMMASAEVISRTNITGKLEGVSADAMNLLQKWIERETQNIVEQDLAKKEKK